MLENRKTKTLVDVKFHRLNIKDLRHFGISKKAGWKFDWRKSISENCQVYAIFALSNQNEVQGLISLKEIDPTDNYIEIQSIESAPHNKVENVNRVYRGVGVHLVAFACRISLDFGFQGYVTLNSKSKTIDFYVKPGAIQIVNGVVYFNTSAALNLTTRCQL